MTTGLSVTGRNRSYSRKAGAFLIAEASANADAALAALEYHELRLLGRFGFGEARRALVERTLPDLLLIVLDHVDDDIAIPVLALARDLGDGHPLRTVLACAGTQIDLASTCFPGDAVQILCEPREADWQVAIGWATRPGPGRLQDSAQEENRIRLVQIAQRVTVMADGLADLARQVRKDLALAPPGDPDETAAEALAVRRLIRSRQLRSDFLPGGLLADPAWDMLLQLYATRLEGGRISVSGLCMVSGVPGTTALRWIGLLHDAGLCVREVDVNDRRRCHVVLTESAYAAMSTYFSALRYRGLPSA